MSAISATTLLALVLIPLVWLSLPVSVCFVANEPVIALCVAGVGFGGSIIVDGLLMADDQQVASFAMLSSTAHLLAAATCFAYAFAGETEAQRAQRITFIAEADAVPCEELSQQFVAFNPLQPVGVACLDFVRSVMIWACTQWRVLRPARHTPRHAAI